MVFAKTALTGVERTRPVMVLAASIPTLSSLLVMVLAASIPTLSSLLVMVLAASIRTLSSLLVMVLAASIRTLSSLLVMVLAASIRTLSGLLVVVLAAKVPRPRLHIHARYALPRCCPDASPICVIPRSCLPERGGD